MRVAVYGRNFEKDDLEYIEKFFSLLRERKISIILFKDFYDFLLNHTKINIDDVDVFYKTNDLKLNIDLLFTIGGDGTILSAIPYVRNYKIPIVGINLGRLGFLASIAKEEIELALEAIVIGDYKIEERSLLKLKTSSNLFEDFPYSLNEIAVQKVDSTMITAKVDVDGEFLNTYWADGLIISTPTGSTAYSLSVGGPIIVPQSGNFIISPISPHNLTVRPIVLPDTSSLKLKIEGRSPNYIISLDHRSMMVKNTEEIEITKADFRIKLIKIKDASFYKTLRNKLMWGIDKRN